MGDDIGSGLSSTAVCFDFHSTNAEQLSNWNLYFYWFPCHHPFCNSAKHCQSKAWFFSVFSVNIQNGRKNSNFSTMPYLDSITLAHSTQKGHSKLCFVTWPWADFLVTPCPLFSPHSYWTTPYSKYFLPKFTAAKDIPPRLWKNDWLKKLSLKKKEESDCLPFDGVGDWVLTMKSKGTRWSK